MNDKEVDLRYWMGYHGPGISHPEREEPEWSNHELGDEEGASGGREALILR